MIFGVGAFLSSIDIIIGVIIIESCTINAVFALEVLVSASIQKVLLATETRLINIQIAIFLLLKAVRCFLKKAKVINNPNIEHINRMKKGGSNFNSILDHMYEEPQNKAFSNKKN